MFCLIGFFCLDKLGDGVDSKKNVLPQLLQLYQVIVINLYQRPEANPPFPYIEGAKPNCSGLSSRLHSMLTP